MNRKDPYKPMLYKRGAKLARRGVEIEKVRNLSYLDLK